MNFLKYNDTFVIMPYLTLGLLDQSSLIDLIDFFINNGVKAVEFGFPFSDSIADGSIIQHSNQIALSDGFDCYTGFNQLAQIRKHFPDLSIALMVYANLIYGYGMDDFYSSAQQAGINAVLVPDVPNIEALPFIQSAKAHSINPVLFATPNCSSDDISFVAQNSKGFVYLVSRAGVTGTDKTIQFDQLQTTLHYLVAAKSPPVICGFGIKSHKDLHNAKQMGCQGAILGSVLIDCLIQPNTTMSENLSVLRASFLNLIRL